MNDRIFKDDDNLWYYRIRGNDKVGPFDSHTDAERKLTKQMSTWNRSAGPKASWPRAWTPARAFRRSATRQT